MKRSMFAGFFLAAAFLAGPICGDTLWADPFTDGDDQGWTKPVPSYFAVESGEYHRSLAGADNDSSISYVGDGTWRNYTVETDAKMVEDVPGGWATVCFRIMDNLHYYYFMFEPSTDAVKLQSCNGATGSYSILGTASYVTDKNLWYRLKVTLRGDSIYCYVNNSLLIQYRDTRYPAGGAGVTALHSHSHFDNFMVTAPVPPALVAYYPFTGNADDSSGRGSDGVVAGAALTTDRFGNPNSAYSFDGINDYISAGTVDFSVPVSVSLWFKSSVVNAVYHSVLAWNNEAYPQQGIQLFADGAGKFNVRIGFGSDRKTLSIVDGDNAWHHLAATRDATNSLKVYVDGVLEVSSSNTSALGSNHTLYFGRTFMSNEFFNGAIDDIRIYNYAISAAQADSLHNLTSGPPNNAPQFISSPVTGATEDLEYTYSITAVDVDLDDTLTLMLDTLPQGMTLTGNVIRWTPGNASVGNNRVVIRARDNHGAYTLQRYTLAVINTNDAPEILSAPPLIGTQGLQYQYQVNAVDVDAGDAKTFALTLAPAGMAISGPGLITWTPSSLQIGQNSVTLVVRDGSLAADTQSWTITVSNVNDAPVISTLVLDTAEENAVYTDSVKATDADGNAIFWTLLQAPDSLAIGLTTGVLSWRPGDSQTGNQVVRVRATDGVLSDTATFNIHVRNINDAPVITSIPVTTVKQDQAYAYQVTVSDPDPGDHAAFAVAARYAGISISTSGRITWTPNAAQVGVCSVTVVVRDDSLAADTQSFQLIVENVNDAPVISTLLLDTATEDRAFSDTLAASDPDGNMIFWSLLAGPDSLRLDRMTGALAWLPLDQDAGTDTIKVRATDGVSSDTAVLVLRVLRVNDAPRIAGAFPDTLKKDSLYIIPLSAFDEEGDPLTWTIPDKPSNMQIIDTSVVWVPNAAQVGWDTLTIIVSDGALTDTLQAIILVTEPSAVEDPMEIPLECSLSGSPNPFNPAVLLKVGVPAAVRNPLTLRIYGIQGKLLKSWRMAGAGYHQIAWNAVDANGKPLSTGTYVARLSGGKKVLQQKLLLLK